MNEQMELQVNSTNPVLQDWIERLTTTYSSQRLLALQGLLYKAHRAAGQVPLSGEVLVQTLEVWAETLEPVPTMSLETCYRKALHAKDNTFVVSAQDILVAYNADQSEHENPEERKHAEWQALARGSAHYREAAQEARPRAARPCTFPGCTEPCLTVVVARYCQLHGEPATVWREPKELYKMMLEAKGVAR
jgi:hypothetical protein